MNPHATRLFDRRTPDDLPVADHAVTHLRWPFDAHGRRGIEPGNGTRCPEGVTHSPRFEVPTAEIELWFTDRGDKVEALTCPAMPVVPDTKDWTWVLRRPCPECGFDASSLSREQVPVLIRANVRAWLPILAESPQLLRRRTGDDRWSPLEYGCHVRDVFRLYHRRLHLMLTVDNPSYPNWDQDRSAVDDRYNDQDPALVAAQLGSAAESLAVTFDAVDGPAWDRLGTRSDGANFTVDTFGRYMIHDPVHHLYDVMVDLPKLKS